MQSTFTKPASRMLLSALRSFRKIFPLLLLLISFDAYTQVLVTGTAGGTLDGNYPNIQQTGGFAQVVNGTDQTGADIVITLTADLNSGTGSSFYNPNWHSLTIVPSGNRILGNTINSTTLSFTNCPRVTIDGLNTGGNSLSIENSCVSYGASVLSLDVSKNSIIRNCTLSLGTTSGFSSSIIRFPTASDSNLVENCTFKRIASAGLYTAGIDATGNYDTVRNCSFQDYGGNNVTFTYGINATGGGWQISNNRFFQSATRTVALNNVIGGIRLSAPNNIPSVINGNTIGYATLAGTGTSTFSGQGGVEGIDVFNGVITVQNNVISGITYNTTFANGGQYGSFNGIRTSAGQVTVSDNIIGAASGTGAIKFSSSVTGTTFNGINALSPTALTANNNTISSIQITGAATIAYRFNGINVSNGISSIVNGNTIGSSTTAAISVGTAGTTTAACVTYGICAQSHTGTLQIGDFGMGNTINNVTGNSTNNTLAGIYFDGGAADAVTNVKGNTILNTSHAGTLGLLYGIWNKYTNAANCNISNNTIDLANFTAATGNVTAYGISNTPTLFTNLAVNGNVFQNLRYAGTSTGTVYGIYSTSGTNTTANYNDNNFNDLTAKTSAIFYGIYNNSAGDIAMRRNRINTGLTKTIAGSTVFFLYSTTGTSLFVDSNYCANITVTGATSTTGITARATGTTIVTNNTVRDIFGGTTTGISFTGGGAGSMLNNNLIRHFEAAAVSISAGLLISNTTTNPIVILNNRIDSISNSSTGEIVGIYQTGGAVSASKNIISNLRSDNASNQVRGIKVVNMSTASTSTYYNNLVSMLTAPVGGSTTGVSGMYFAFSTPNSAANVYYNTILISGTSSGTNFGSNGIYHLTSATASTGSLDLRNNIIVNTAVAKGTGITAAYQRSSSVSANYASTSNNNIFYAGIPSASNFVFYDGTNKYDLVQFKAAFSPRESFSYTESPTFISTNPGNSNFLHLDPAVPTQAELGAVPITGFTTDVDDSTRNSVRPDIGADEGNFSLLDLTKPVVSVPTTPSTFCLTNQTISNVTITDNAKIDTAAGTKPRLYFKKFTNSNTFIDNTSASDGWKYVEGTYTGGTTFSFTTNYSLLNSPIAEGDVIQYFLLAQDTATIRNVAISNCAFTATPATVNLTAAAFPITGPLPSYNIKPTFHTDQTIGVGGNFPTLGSFFSALGSSALSADITVRIISDINSEPGAFIPVIDQACMSTPHTITIKPAAGATVKVKSASSSICFYFVGASNVVIDGNNGVTDKALSFINSDVGSLFAFENGSSNNTIRNCIIQGDASYGRGALVSIGSAGAASANNNISLINNSISGNTNTGMHIGILCQAPPSPEVPNTNLLISGNQVYGFSEYGVKIQSPTIGSIVRNNIIHDSSSNVPVNVKAGICYQISRNRGAIITGNRIYDLKSIAVCGIQLSAMDADSLPVIVANNMIHIDGTNSSYKMGITDQSVNTAIPVMVANNSVWLSGTLTGGGTTIVYSRGYANTLLKNNIFINSCTDGTSTNRIIQIDNAQNFVSDHNDLIGNGLTDFTFDTAPVADLATWKTTTGQDAHSIAVVPSFVSSADLHLTASNCGLKSMGRTLPELLTDFDNELRDTVRADIGADEFTSVPFSLPTATTCDTRYMSTVGNRFITNGCSVIAELFPNGATPVTGTVSTCEYVNSIPQNFVQRHVDIEPQTNASAATGKVTLYFTDQDFSDYNTANPSLLNLPTVANGGSADPKVANLIIRQYHGSALTTPSVPGQYSTTDSLEINPVDADVKWNGNYWEVSFNVAGFSGFYVSTKPVIVLPIVMEYFRGSKQGSNHLLNWKVNCYNSTTANIILERSTVSNSGFASIYNITATAARCNTPFDFVDANPIRGMNYYRLKMIDADGKTTYSNIVALLNATKGLELTGIAPNPVRDNFKLNITSATAGSLQVMISDVQGRIVLQKNVSLIAGFNTINLNATQLAAGMYYVYGITADEKNESVSDDEAVRQAAQKLVGIFKCVVKFNKKGFQFLETLFYFMEPPGRGSFYKYFAIPFLLILPETQSTQCFGFCLSLGILCCGRPVLIHIKGSKVYCNCKVSLCTKSITKCKGELE